VNVLHSICNPYGSVLRIVVMRRRGVQALIEFDDVGTATRAKEALHNQDIYAGCNTLKVEYSTSERVNVRYNTEDMWDYTGQNLQNAPPQRSNSFSQPGNFGGALPQADAAVAAARPSTRAAPLCQGRTPCPGRPPDHNVARRAHSPDAAALHRHRFPAGQRASFGGAPDPYGRPGFPQGGAVGGDRGAPGRASFGGAPEQFGYGDRRGSGFQGPGGQWGGQGGAAARPSWGAQGQVAAGGAGQPYLMPGSVVMMYQLDAQRFNVNTLFNWMCLFANPHKIKFLVQKPGTAMIQFGHPQEAQDAMTHAHETVIFGQKVECAKSRSDDIKTPMNTKALDKLPDGTDCFKDFSQSKNLRYPYQPGQPRTRRPCNKSATVHYFNAPKNCDLAKLRAIFTSVGIKAPGKMERFVDDETKRTDRGLMEWDSIVEATEAIIMGNHFEMQGDDQQTYTIKLAYSSRSLNPQTAVQFDAATGAASALEGGATAVGAEITQGSGDGAAAPTGDADAQVEFKTEASADGAEASGETQQEE